MTTKRVAHVTRDLTLPDRPIVATHHRASVESVKTVLSAPIEDDGRSEWEWVRLPNGDLILGIFPLGETYFEVEGDASTPDQWHDPNAPTAPTAPTFVHTSSTNDGVTVEVDLLLLLSYGETYEHFEDLLTDKIIEAVYPGWDTLTDDDIALAATTEVVIHRYALTGVSAPNIAVFTVECTFTLPDGVQPAPKPTIPEPTSDDTIDVIVTLSADDAWEAWRVNVPADATDEWIEANWEQEDNKDMRDSGATSYTVTGIER